MAHSLNIILAKFSRYTQIYTAVRINLSCVPSLYYRCLCLRFMLNLKKDKRVEYVQKITSMATSIGFKVYVQEYIYVAMYTDITSVSTE